MWGFKNPLTWNLTNMFVVINGKTNYYLIGAKGYLPYKWINKEYRNHKGGSHASKKVKGLFRQ